MANEETQIAKNPEDYSLWHIGTFETTTGELTPIIKQRKKTRLLYFSLTMATKRRRCNYTARR